MDRLFDFYYYGEGVSATRIFMYINGPDIYWIVKCSFHSNHILFTADIDFLSGYVFPNMDRDPSRSSVSIFV